MTKLTRLFILWCTVAAWSVHAGPLLYDCASPRPEMAGTHNMVVFGDPSDRIYAYHLPLFQGDLNGRDGHVLMHVYQALWHIGLDEVSTQAYREKFNAEKSAENPLPFFSLSPNGEPFRVPQMICDLGFRTQARLVYGHVEGNPQFPPPQDLIDGPSHIRVTDTIFGRRFDQSGPQELTYFVFGSPEQVYLAHYLSDDDNSFDQIVAIEPALERNDFLSKVDEKYSMVTVPLSENKNLVPVENLDTSTKDNHKWRLPVGETVNLLLGGDMLYPVKISASVYFNDNRDLKIRR